VTDPTRPQEWQDSPTRYSPPPEPRPSWPEGTAPSGTPERWFEPAPTGAVAPQTVRSRREGNGTSLGALLGISLLSAILASAATIYGLNAVGVFNRPAASGATSPIASPVSQPGATAAPGGGSVTIDEQSAVTRAAQQVSPAVVTISTGEAAGANPLNIPSGVGSGIIYDASGWILTNRHVVCGSTNVSVELQNGAKYAGKVYGLDTLTDLAIVKITGSNLPAATLGDSGALKPGQLAIAIGSPLGEFTNSVTSGVVSAVARDISVNDECRTGGGGQRPLRNLIQTDAAINPGNSGGALVNSAGQVIGVNTAVAGNAQGIGFAIPINVAKPIMRQAVAGEKLARPWIGIYYEPITAEVKKQDNLPIDYGAWIHRAEDQSGPSIVPNSPADKAGLRQDDIITAVNGQRVDVSHTLDDILTQFKPGDQITVSVLRGGNTMDVKVTLGTRPDQL
jgi:S1-C subfamily serine protease